MSIFNFERFEYQKRWLEWSGDRTRLGNFSKTGVGKTVMAIDWLNMHGFRSVLIVCPKSAMKHTWYDNLKDNFQNDMLMICKGTAKQRQDLMEKFLKKSFKGAFIINYDIIDKHCFELCNMGFDCVIFDEAHKVGGMSKRTNAAKKIAKVNKPEAKWMGCLLLSGTVSPKNLLGYYNPVVLIQGVENNSFYSWRTRLFNTFTIPNTNITTYNPKDGASETILGAVNKNSFTATEGDTDGKMPARMRQVLAIPLSKEQDVIYNSLLKDNIVSINGTEISCDSNASRATKLLQVSSGFIYDNDGNAIKISDNRTKLMAEALESFGEGEQCIIWYAYKWQREEICKKLGCECYSMLSDKNKEKYIEDFISGKNKYFVAHPKSCGESLTLVNCNHEIWYCLNGDLRAWMQAGDRICRLGQKKNVVSVTLQSEETYDENVYDGIINGFDADKIVMEFFRKGSK